MEGLCESGSDEDMPMDRRAQKCRLESNAPSVCRAGVHRINNNYERAALLATGSTTAAAVRTTALVWCDLGQDPQNTEITGVLCKNNLCVIVLPYKANCPIILNVFRHMLRSHTAKRTLSYVFE